MWYIKLYILKLKLGDYVMNIVDFLIFIQTIITLTLFFYITYSFCIYFIKSDKKFHKVTPFKISSEKYLFFENLFVCNYSVFHKYDIWRYFRLKK
jgi:hypothetical protein